ncbi:MAG: hypothetical protein JW910_12040, partial [Anaerolineae bacterium]|nr:hypothetical protein [Anaerolineae bacterium]
MPIYSAWDNAAQTVVRLTFDDEWTIEDLRTAYDQARELIAAAPGSQPVDLILDFEASGPVPADTLRAVVRLFQQTREPVGALVYFG